ncbi:YigZ family protein [bacterium]|nr:YigZ family protein [bacterium]
MNDEYRTLTVPVSHEIKVKGSRFIGLLVPAETRESAERMLAEIRKRYFDATHHCYAFRIGTGNALLEKFHDDGEPCGTAGRPILECLAGREITFVLGIVVRYFGGTKLGTGGLARAYGQCMRETVGNARIVKKTIQDSVGLLFDYHFMGPVMSLISKYQCETVDMKYGDRSMLTVKLRQSRKNEFLKALTDQTAGQIRFLEVGGD